PSTDDFKNASPIVISAKGNSEKLSVSADAQDQWSLNSEWALGEPLRLLQGNLVSSSLTLPQLNDQSRLTIALQGLQGDKWLPT
ncbi:hypothetical protein ACWWJS_26485, partial [Enterobacter cloacae]